MLQSGISAQRRSQQTRQTWPPIYCARWARASAGVGPAMRLLLQGGVSYVARALNCRADVLT